MILPAFILASYALLLCFVAALAANAANMRDERRRLVELLRTSDRRLFEAHMEISRLERRLSVYRDNNRKDKPTR